MESSVFCDPGSGRQLFWSDDHRQLVNESGLTVYQQKNGCLNFLPHTPESGDFAYRDHYQKDAEVFDYFSGWEDPAAVHENRRLHEMILSRASTKPQRVLDVGCGAAWVAAHFADRGVEVYSMDVSTVNPERAVATYPFAGHYGVVADVFHLPFQERSFDLIIASEIIEHVPDPAQFLRVLLPTLAPGGVLVVTTPHAEKLAHSLCIHCNRPTPHHGHLHSFTAAALKGLLPAPLQANARTYTFVNKLLLHARTHAVLRFLPFGLWRAIDQFFNLFIAKTARLMLVVKRPVNN